MSGSNSENLRRLLLPLIVVLGLIIGPTGALGALELTGACNDGCPCDRDVESHEDDCDDHHSDADPHAQDEAEDDCADDCSECDCDAGVVSAVAPPSVDVQPNRVPDTRGLQQRTAPVNGPVPDIFIPPRH